MSKSQSTIAERIHEGRRARCELEDLLDDAGLEFETIGADDYDNSVEINDVPPEQRLSAVAQRVIHDAGFSIAFVNHTDKWETHYRFKRGEPFAEVKGWRVSYPSSRNDDGPILVEAVLESWPRDWFETGYAKVVGDQPDAE